MKRIVFNGKFYSGGLNGVHRVADRLIREVDTLLLELPAAARPKVEVILPASAKWRPEVGAIQVVTENGRCGQFWEQTKLPWKTCDAVLVNLCNLAPILHRSKLLLIHDIQFYFSDSSYPLRQRVGYQLLVPWMARTSEKVLTVSAFSRQMLDAFGVARRERVDVLHNGVDHILETVPSNHRLAENGLVTGGFVVLFGSGKAYKNNQVVFDAFHDPRLAGLKLAVVGPSRATLEAAGLKVPASAVFVGSIDDAGLRELLDGALCLAFPSRTEGFGLPPAEAMICGCPAVVAPSGAIPEVCRDAVSYADVDDPEGWVDAIARMRNDADFRATKIDAGRTLMPRFTWRRAGEMLLAQIVAMAGGKEAVRPKPDAPSASLDASRETVQ